MSASRSVPLLRQCRVLLKYRNVAAARHVVNSGSRYFSSIPASRNPVTSRSRYFSSIPLNGHRSQLLAAASLHQQGRFFSMTPNNTAKAAETNTIINFVPQQEAWIVERMGKYLKTLEPGVNFLIPFVDRIAYVQSLKEIAVEIPHQSAITVDNVMLTIDGVLYVRVFDPYKASYGVEDVEFAISQLAQTTMRSEVGKISLDTVFRERERLNEQIVYSINNASEPWGVSCMRYEIREMKMPDKVQEAMQMQVEAERRKRASILQSEGIRQSEINQAEGKKRAAILISEAAHTEQINRATGEAEAIIARANARAAAIEKVATALQKAGGSDAASLTVAEQYVRTFGNLAKTNNTVILPANVGDANSMVAQAMAIYKSMNGNQSIKSAEGSANSKSVKDA